MNLVPPTQTASHSRCDDVFHTREHACFGGELVTIETRGNSFNVSNAQAVVAFWYSWLSASNSSGAIPEGTAQDQIRCAPACSA